MSRTHLLLKEEWAVWEAEQRAHEVEPSSVETGLGKWKQWPEENSHHIPGSNGHCGPNGNGNGNGTDHDWKLRPVYRQAEAHCANWCKGGTCAGIAFNETGRGIWNGILVGRCLLLSGQRCPYFEEAVLPMEKRKEDDWKPFAAGRIFREAAKLYHETFPETAAVEATTRKCPDCGKHRIEARKRCCAKCRIRRRKLTKADYQRKWRKEAVQRSTVNGNGSSPRATSQGTTSKPAVVYQFTPVSSP
jgi:hypothetical protein